MIHKQIINTSNKHNHFIIKFISIVTVIMIILISFSIFRFFKSIDEFSNKSTNTITNNCIFVTDIFTQINNSLNAISKTYNVTHDADELSDLLEKELSWFNNPENLNVNFFIYSADGNNLYSTYDDEYDLFNIVQDNLNSQSIYTYYWNEDSDLSPCIIVTPTIADLNTSSLDYYCFATIDTETIIDKIIFDDYIVGFQILDNANELIFEFNTTETTNSSYNYIKIANASTFNFEVIYSQTASVHLIYRNLLISIICIIILFIAIILLTFKFSEKILQPIQNSLDIVSNEYAVNYSTPSDLFSAVNLLLEDKSKLEHEHNKKLKLLQSNFINQLLMAEFNNKDIIKSLCTELDVPIAKTEEVSIIIINLTSDAEENSNYTEQKIFLSQNFSTSLNGNFHIHEVDNNKLVLLISVDETQTEQQVINKVESIFNSFTNKNPDIIIHFSIGILTKKITNIYKSYLQAENNLNLFINSNVSKIIDYHNTTNHLIIYLYPKNFENKLISTMQNDTECNIEELFDELMELNSHVPINSNIYYLLMNELLLSYKKILLHVKEFFNEPFERHNLILNEAIITIKTPQALNMLIKVYKDLKEEIQLLYTNKSNKFKLDILNYVDENCTNINFSLSMVSEKFDIPKYTVSNYFINETGTKFTKYVEDIRMKRSNDLIQKTDLSIEQIAQNIGYSSSTSFRRAYKRYFNKSPRD